MAVRGTRVGRSFDKLKAANPGMSDTEAMQRAIGLSTHSTAAGRVKAKKMKRSRVKMAITKDAGVGHSPAGAAHLRRLKRSRKTR
jgi:mannitol-specific phosphotransferase system IIBC component